MTTPSKGLLPLLAQLKHCPSRDGQITEKRFHAMWNEFRQIALDHGDTIIPAVIVGVILYDPETFASLLNEAEHAQLLALGKTALERYEQQTHPPNKLGKTIAAALKESI